MPLFWEEVEHFLDVVDKSHIEHLVRFIEDKDLWRWLQTLPDANGRAQGVGLGSLESRRVEARASSGRMKPTAAH